MAVRCNIHIGVGNMAHGHIHLLGKFVSPQNCFINQSVKTEIKNTCYPLDSLCVISEKLIIKCSSL
jgi:hypothetical protein